MCFVLFIGSFDTKIKMMIILNKQIKKTIKTTHTILKPACYWFYSLLHTSTSLIHFQIIHHHHHVREGLGLIPVPCILKMKLVPPSLPRSSYVSLSFGLYCSACLGILFVSILCMCCSHFSWYCFISFTIFCAPVFSLIHCFF